MTTQASTTNKTESKKPWILVFLNAGALMSSLYQIHHLYLMLGAS